MARLSGTRKKSSICLVFPFYAKIISDPVINSMKHLTILALVFLLRSTLSLLDLGILIQIEPSYQAAVYEISSIKR